MIIKSPYSFLIKNFRKIHIAFLVLCIFIYSKTLQAYSFVNEFIKLGTYDSYSEPVGNYVNAFLILATLIVAVGSVLILMLLKKKQKPWRAYLVPVITYIVLLLGFILVRNFFIAYTGGEPNASIRAVKDMLFIGTFPQYFIFALWVIRILGLDLKKFDFKKDEEFLQLEDKDKQEFEFSINIDKHSFIRAYKRAIRNIGYFYQEHKTVLNGLGIFLVVFVLFKAGQTAFVTHKTYRQGQNFGSNGYTIVVNNAYFTNKDYRGSVIDPSSNFLVVDVTITNNYNRRKINFNRFHAMNGVNNYSPTSKTYETYFNDLGVAYDDKTISKGESFDTLLIYKVDKKLKRSRFVLYYQEIEYSDNYLRKIKLKVKDVSKIKNYADIKQEEYFDININGEEEEIAFSGLEYVNKVTYSRKSCTYSDCPISNYEYSEKSGYKILKMNFDSNGVDGKEMIDFLSKYGKINYIDSKSEEKSIDIVNAVGRPYYGKYVYIRVPDEVTKSKDNEMVITVRNVRYHFSLDEGE